MPITPYLLTCLLTYLPMYLLTVYKSKNSVDVQTVYTSLLSMTQTSIVSSRIGQVVHTLSHTHTQTHLHCTGIRITIFIDKECVSLHEKKNRQMHLCTLKQSIAPYLLTCLHCKSLFTITTYKS